MQKAETTLSILNQKSKSNENYVFDRIYRNLFNKELFIRAYRKIYAKEGNMTEGVDGNTIDGFKMGTIENLIARLKEEKYQPKAVRRTYIPKKNGKLRPLGIPAFEDKLVQEAARQILEAIYEPLFSKNSHGFRPKRSCQTALHQIKSNCKGTNWVIEGDITGCFDNIDHDILIMLLSKKIKDGRFLELIRRFLKAGYFEFKQMHNSLSGTPQGGIISPILANIYLHELDKYMEALIRETTKGKEKKLNKEYHSLANKRWAANKKGNLEQAEMFLKEMRKLPARDPMDSGYVRVHYVRYADDFLICINGSKEISENIKEKVTNFLKETLKLELNKDKTLITNIKENRVRFLGYEISKSIENTALKETRKGVKERTVNGTIQLLVPSDVINDKISLFSRYGKAVHYNVRANLPVLDMINQYNAEIRGLYNYYCLATDVSTKINKFKHIHYFSLAKTIAKKEKSSVRKVIKKYGIAVPLKVGKGTRNIIGVKYQTKKGESTMTYFNESLKKVDEPMTEVSDVFSFGFNNGCQLIKRINANKCELCGTENGDIEVHHVRKLKDIISKYKKRGKQIPDWVLTMSRIKRKTLVVCESCHDKIHSGKY